MSKTKSIPHLIDDRPAWDLIQKRNEEFLKELEAKYGPRPTPAVASAISGSAPLTRNGDGRTAKVKSAAKSRRKRSSASRR